ncbi:uncharacterized protein BDV17DRAFT_50756 [Aspergillus undulatus]|uniref:uncharacterized protein n=1 Tax=Aspergillus undulatus TaxID=1810928 RepID=UPI003CCE1B2F
MSNTWTLMAFVSWTWFTSGENPTKSFSLYTRAIERIHHPYVAVCSRLEYYMIVNSDFTVNNDASAFLDKGPKTKDKRCMHPLSTIASSMPPSGLSSPHLSHWP